MQQNIRYSVVANLIRTICLTLLSFISFPFVCRVLGETTLGTYTWANTFVYYFLVIAKLGIPTLAIRECSKVRDNPKALSKKAQEFFIIQGILTLISFGLMCVIIFTIKGDFWLNKDLIFILSINFLVGVFSFEWIYIALEKHFYIAFRSIVSLALSALLIISLIKYDDQVYLYALLTILVTITTVICNLFNLKKHISFKKVEKYNFKQYILPLTIIFSISLIGTLYNYTDTFIVGLIDSTKAEVGSYSVGIKSIEIIITIITSLSAVFIPRATELYKKDNKVFFNNLTKYAFNICIFIAVPAIATMTLLSSQITSIISGNAIGYINAPYTLMILASMVLTFSLADMIYSQVLLPMHKEKYYLYVMIFGTILNITASIILGYIFKDSPSVGVAIATATTDVLILLTLVIIARKHVAKAIINLNTLKIFASGILISIITFFLLPALSTLESYLQLIIIIIVDGAIYLLTLLALKENLVSSFVNRNKK